MAETVLAKMAVQIAANTAQFNLALAQSQKQFTGFIGGIKSAGATLGAGLGIGAALSVLQDAVNSIKDLDQQLATVKAITGATGTEFDNLRASALKLGQSTQFTAIEVAKLQTEFGRLGFTTEEILDATSATINLATATGEDLAKAADTAGSTIRGFGLNANETKRVTDVMAESFNRSALGLENFTEAMKYVAPIARSAGLSLEETTAALSVLADSGIRGSQAGTSFRKIITDLAKDSRPYSERLKELAARGISFAQANDEVGRTAYASLLVLTANQKKVDDLTSAYNNVGDAAKEAADIVGNTLAGDLRKLAGAYDGLIQSAGGATDILREFVQAGTSVLQALNAQDGALGLYLEKWLKLALTIPRTVAAIVTELGKDVPLEEALETINGLLAKIRNPDQDTLNKYLDGLAVKAKEAGKELVVYRDEFGKVQVFIKNNPIKTIVDPKANDDIKATFETIDSLQAKIKELKRVMEEDTPITDTLRLKTLQTEIDKTQLRLNKLFFSLSGGSFKPDFSGIGEDFDFGEPVKIEPEFVVDPQTGVLVESLGEALDGLNQEMYEFLTTQDGFAGYGEAYIDMSEKIKKETYDLTGVVHSALSGIGQALGNAISGSQDLGDSLLKVLGSVLVTLGEMILAAGIGVEAFKTSLETLQGPVAIAAGIALIALGTALSSSISSLGSNPTSGGSRSSSSSQADGEFRGLKDNGLEIMIGGEVRIDGDDLVYVINRNKQLSSRTTG